MAPRSRRPLGRNHPTRTLTEDTLIWSLTVHVVRTAYGLATILAGLILAPLGHRPAAIALVLLGALVYAEQCKRTPYTDCWRCHGIGYRHRPRGWLLRTLLGTGASRCRPCHGHGVRMRWGRRAMNAYRRATYTPPRAPEPADAALLSEHAGPVNPTDALRRRYATDPTRTPREPR